MKRHKRSERGGNEAKGSETVNDIMKQKPNKGNRNERKLKERKATERGQHDRKRNGTAQRSKTEVNTTKIDEMGWNDPD